jgi:hypothetical protein
MQWIARDIVIAADIRVAKMHAKLNDRTELSAANGQSHGASWKQSPCPESIQVAGCELVTENDDVA